MTGIALAALALVLSRMVPPVLARARWLEHVPRAGVVLWQAVALAAVLAAVGAVLAAPEELFRAYSARDGARVVPVLLATATVAAVGAAIIVLRLAIIAVRLGLDTRRRRARHTEMLDLLEGPSPNRVHVLAGPIPMAYCVPGHSGRVVLTEATVDVLDDAQVQAVIEHERAHLRARHDLVREAFTALHVAFPRVARSQVARAAVDHLLELLADDGALHRIPEADLRGALAVLSRNTGEPRTAARFRRLAGPQPSQGRRRLLAAATYLLAAAVLVVPTAALAGPWLARATTAVLGG
ncbi:MAG TPA: M56 family metallopeptidase [Beutenbergiaceae bacterium]|nr:M56 family metallopeptidase [Beutenbergiaceae bacterium]